MACDTRDEGNISSISKGIGEFANASEHEDDAAAIATVCFARSDILSYPRFIVSRSLDRDIRRYAANGHL